MDNDERITKLEARLQDGYTRIGEAMKNGVKVENWERHWIELLREFEALEDEKAAHHAEVRQQGELPAMPRKEVVA